MHDMHSFIFFDLIGHSCGVKESSTINFQRCAQDALEDAMKWGAECIPALAAASSVGTFGAHPGNCPRDLQRYLTRIRRETGWKLEPSKISITLQKKIGIGSVVADHYVLYPHEVVHEIWASGRWNELMFDTEDSLQEFWAHDSTKKWLIDHPVMLNPGKLEKAIPWFVHCDGVAHVKYDKVMVVSGGSALSPLSSMLSHMLYTVCPYKRLIKTETLEDVYAPYVWSLWWCMVGVFPTRGPYHNEWPADSFQAKMAGQPLAGGWCIVLAMLRADLEWMASTYGWNSYLKTSMCHRCLASKNLVSLAYTDLRLHNACWLHTQVCHADYLANTDASARSVWFAAPGMFLETNKGDAMHGIDLGIGQDCAAEGILELGGSSDRHLKILHDEFKQYCKDKHFTCSQPLFTEKMLTLKRTQYPMLKSKAANCRYVIEWLASATSDAVARGSDNEQMKMVATACWALADFTYCMRAFPRFLTPPQRDRMVYAGQVYLLVWNELAYRSFHAGILRFHIRPKTHYFAHMILDIQTDSTNPRCFHCYSDEDYVGRVGKLVHRVCGRSYRTGKSKAK